MDLSYILADPSGNTTAFVLTPVARESYGPLARQVMAALDAEQVAFVHDDRMDMMGGEFCGNASRSFALWQALHTEDGLSLRPFTGQQTVTVRVSGAPHPLEVTPRGDGQTLRAAVSMPLPLRVLPLADPSLGPVTLVEYPGISHLVLEGGAPDDGDLAAARALLTALDADSGCFGLLYTDSTHMRPLVYVRDTDTLIWEASCASGTCAVAAARALAQKTDLQLELFQPGGSLTAKAHLQNGQLTALTLDGPVTFPKSGILHLPLHTERSHL
jgi:diaminopimelate epimerase